jgi:hypothetical protein
MSWALTVWPPNRDILSVLSYANTDSSVSVLANPSPAIKVEPPDRTVDIVFQVAPGTGISPRSIVRFGMTDASANTITAEGVVTILPGGDSLGAGPADQAARELMEVQAESLELLLKETIIDEPLVIVGDQVYDVAYTFASTFKHPGYDTDPANFTGNPADAMEVAFAPEMTMYDFLKSLTEQFPTYTFYIDTAGDLHFELA